MPRSANKKLKYNLSVNCNGTQLHNENYCSLKEISNYLNIPYTTTTDIYEGRRKSMNKYSNCKFFPELSITLLTSTPPLDEAVV
jgi:hypothetical protein